MLSFTLYLHFSVCGSEPSNCAVLICTSLASSNFRGKAESRVLNEEHTQYFQANYANNPNIETSTTLDTQ